MNLLPIQQPTIALSITEEALCLVEIKTRWRKKVLHNINRLPMEPGILKLSSAKPNIEQPEEFITNLRTLIKGYSTPLPIAICLPDLCARTSIFEFTNFPTNQNDQLALVNWRFQQSLKLDTSQSRLAYHVYVPQTVSNSDGSVSPDLVKVLGTTIRNEIIEQYERVCIQANILPTSVGLFGLDTFDLYQANVHEMLETEDRRSSSASLGGMYLFLSSWGFTFLAFHDGCPNFTRTKAIPIKEDASRIPQPGTEELPEDTPGASVHSNESLEAMAFSQSAMETQTAHSPYPSYTTMKVGKEILATLQFYLETLSKEGSLSSSINLFVATDLNLGHRLLPTTPEIQQILHASGESLPTIQVTPLEHPLALTTLINKLPADLQGWTALPGYANLMVA